MNAALTPTAWTTGSTEVFKTGTWRALLPEHVMRPSPCQQACPVNGDIAQWIGHARDGDLRRAWEVLTLHNPFPAIAGRICHHPCETACNRGAYDEALSICRLERAAGDAALAADWQYAPPEEERPGHIAVVGGGPSGLSAAYQLRRRGWRVSLYEARAELGGLMRYGIPPYRLSRAVLDGEIERIVRLGVQVHVNRALAGPGDLEQLAARHDAVYLATGAAISRPLPQFPADAPWLMQGSDYLALSNAGKPPRLGRRVAVIGGGSAAMDVARSARRAGCEVLLLALEPRERLPAQREELQEALEEGVVLHDATLLRTVVGDAGQPLSLGCIGVRMESAVRGEAPRITPVEDSSFTLEADAVLVAIGQQADLQPFGALESAGRLLKVDAGQSTSNPRIWAGGDVASLARFVTEAVGMGKRAALDIDRALRELPRVRPVLPPRTTLADIATWYYPPARRPGERRLPPGQRLADGAEVQLALTPQEVAAEASRCFSCGTCTSCDNCFQFCPDLAITHVDGGYAVLADYCKGCGLCVRECPTGSMLIREETK
ncbi:FAD-dependent oxidoreductase [Ramlibacter tataouinensis]|uniref:FAD-dependent oxidoreductase n=1 Tax=Ramlibacter tataouinensis TaxID=94132 RepID=UPI0022F3D557|nr:FAD-dependent oxidoreductase [Ramlibacter tataouinensis]WBY03207.1 FAD-dependent oxidoreductase [Ramlibacter tataouinensis]